MLTLFSTLNFVIYSQWGKTIKQTNYLRLIATNFSTGSDTTFFSKKKGVTLKNGNQAFMVMVDHR